MDPARTATQLTTEHVRDLIAGRPEYRAAVVIAFRADDLHWLTFGLGPRDKLEAASAADTLSQVASGGLPATAVYEDFRLDAAKLKAANDLMAAALKRVVGHVCPGDTNGDGDCGKRHCPYCGDEIRAALKLADPKSA